jgi:hypothetical protein
VTEEQWSSFGFFRFRWLKAGQGGVSLINKAFLEVHKLLHAEGLLDVEVSDVTYKVTKGRWGLLGRFAAFKGLSAKTCLPATHVMSKALTVIPKESTEHWSEAISASDGQEAHAQLAERPKGMGRIPGGRDAIVRAPCDR